MKASSGYHNKHDAGENSFKKGNINFDVLEPETPADERPAPRDRGAALDELPSKRGIFDIHRKQNPVGAWHVFLWTCVFLGSLASVTGILFWAQSVLWMLALPVVLLSLIWSAIMLGLYKARPR